MKKSLLLFCLLISVHYVFAVTTQGHWRWRKDDGSQTTATWLAAENVTPTIGTYDNLRVRVEQYNENSTDTYTLNNLKLQYSLTGADNTWININDSTEHDFALATSTSVADGTATTEQLSTRTGYPFVAGRVISSMAAFTYSLASQKKTEFEYVIKPTAVVKFSTTYYFKCDQGGTTSNPLITLATAATLPVNLVSFGVTNTEGKALVKWTTGSEINNDHFEVLRSQNGQSWQAIASIQAKGNNSSVQNSYEFTDNAPLSGNSYYRLKQVDRDGRTALSDVKNFSLKNLKNIVASIYPNPTAAGINVMLSSYTGTVTATVTNTQGAVVHRQVIAATASTSTYKLNINQKLAPGTYYVNLSGTDLSQKLKVIVQ